MRYMFTIPVALLRVVSHGVCRRESCFRFKRRVNSLVCAYILGTRLSRPFLWFFSYLDFRGLPEPTALSRGSRRLTFFSWHLRCFAWCGLQPTTLLPNSFGIGLSEQTHELF